MWSRVSRSTKVALVQAAAFAMSCGGRNQPTESASLEASVADRAIEPSDASIAERIPDAPTFIDAPETPCASQIRRWADAFPMAAQLVCTVVVRLDHATLRPVGHKFICAPELPISEAAARARARADLALPSYNEPANVANPLPVAQGGDEMFVFFEHPSDFGSIAAVHARSGQMLFGGGMIFGGRGDITYPKEWNTDVATTCSEETLREVGSPLDLPMRALSVLSAPADPRGLLKLVWETGLPASLVHGSARRLRNAVLFTYRPTVADVNDPNAEEIVFVNAGPG